MHCSDARRQIAAGVRPGSRPPERVLLGFHLADCASCRAFLELQTPPDDTLLHALLAQTSTDPSTSSVAPPPRFGRWAIGALVLIILVAGGIGGRALWARTDVGTPSAASNLAAVPPTFTPNLAAAAGGRLSEPISTVAPPTFTPPPSATALPTAPPSVTPTASPTPSSTPEPAQLGTMNILLLGLDRRPQETGPSRTDSLMIVHLNPLSGTVALLSLPRDLWVPLTEYGYSAKINAAYSAGEENNNGDPSQAARVARQTVSELIGQPIDYTIVTTFQGLINSVDRLGGIEINVQKEIYDPTYPTFDYGYMIAHFLPGRQTMDGFTALVYSRTRHADNDFERAKRQQHVVLALADKLRLRATSGGFVATAGLVKALYNDLEYTDLELPTALQLALAMQALDPASVRRDSVDLRYGYETSTTDGAYIIAPDVPAIQQLVADLFGN